MEEDQRLEEQKWCTYMTIASISPHYEEGTRLLLSGNREVSLPLYDP